ncbi:GNAT family N-acetyltransferase [Segnochrobactrum spirostomi]|uniref:GNAT family N-acetyltransferase n=1 Tax=Segnochrobactrum spirostomi TaxID=2608987 RepID=A0A6A7YB15_9HYPH|nr:GNAT family N-acetyltransferase [Segnochrobactrum spirostomi]MQT15188.1 GNAT family N-acetyltransferase [Segnochrobactrum spirostomi]
MKVDVESQPDERDIRLIDEGLDTFNASKAGPDNAQDLWIMARQGDGSLLGGLKGRTFYGWLFIDWLWVSPAARGHGIGARLLARAEHEAKQRQCIGAYVDTFSFQAPEFYRRNGYVEFGRIAELPPGHFCIWLKKTFQALPLDVSKEPAGAFAR